VSLWGERPGDSYERLDPATGKAAWSWYDAQGRAPMRDDPGIRAMPGGRVLIETVDEG
jgi:hypothetical protein